MTATRLEKLQSKVKNMKLDAVLIEDSISLSYITGCHFSAGTLLVTPYIAYLLLDGRYVELARKSIHIPIYLINDYILNRLLKRLKIASLGFVQEKTTYARYVELQQTLIPQVQLKPVDDPVARLRIIKDAKEVQRMREAAELGSKGYDFLLSLLREGITERQLAIQLELFWRAEGGKSGFEPIIAFGANSSMPHYRSTETPLKHGDVVLIDIGVVLEDYHSDMTRCVFYGQPRQRIQKIYEIVRKAQEKALSKCHPGITTGELDAAARSYIEKEGYGEQFSHGLGHGVGLEIHEAPRLSQREPHGHVKLRKGMAVTIEPGIYLPGVGGVRIEDTVVVTATGYENLSRPSKELLVLGW